MLQGSNCPSSKKFYIEDEMADDYVKPIFKKSAAEVSPDKRAGEPKAEILMAISESWNDLIISCNEKLIWRCHGLLELSFVVFLSAASWYSSFGASWWSWVRSPFLGCFNFIYSFYYIDSIPLPKSGVLGFTSIISELECNEQMSKKI